MRFRQWSMVSFLIVVLAAYARAEEKEAMLPSTPAGQQAQALLEALASGDRDTIGEFIQEQFAEAFLQAIPLQNHIEANAGMAESTGGIIPRKIVSSSETSLQFIGQARKGRAEWQIAIEVESEAPHKIARLGFMPPRRWADVPAPALPEGPLKREQLANYLDSYLEALEERDAFSGAVLLARGDEIIFHRACGLASRAWNIPNRPDTKFNLGSMNKMFTSVAIAQLVEQGKLSLDDPIAKHLPEYPNQEVARQVTVRHLLSHSSGLSDYFNDEFMKTSRDRLRDIDDYIPLFAEEPLQFEPGTRFAYSNAGFMVLGAIVEKVSGQDYFEYVRQHIYEPAGMKNTDAYELDRDTPNLAVGYTREGVEGDDEWRNNTFLHVIKGGPAGGGYSTAEDLYRFARALEQGKLIKPETLDQWTRPGDLNPSYAFGFEVLEAEGQRMFGHRGGFPGISSMLRVDRDSGLIIVVLSNIDHGVQPLSKLDELAGKLQTEETATSN